MKPAPIDHTFKMKERERCAKIAENEPEPKGEMPMEFYNVPLDDAIKAAVRATKKSIAARIRKLL